MSYFLSTPIDDPSRRRFQIESAAFSFCLNSYNIIQLRKRSERWLSPELTWNRALFTPFLTPRDSRPDHHPCCEWQHHHRYQGWGRRNHHPYLRDEQPIRQYAGRNRYGARHQRCDTIFLYAYGASVYGWRLAAHQSDCCIQYAYRPDNDLRV